MSDCVEAEGALFADYHVGIHDTDMFGLCRPSSFLKFFQDAANQHCLRLGIDIGSLMRKSHAVWMLVRLKYELDQPIFGGEDLQIKTFYYKPKGAFVFRDFLILVKNEPVGHAYSTWVLGDIENHTLLNAEEVLSQYPSPVLPVKTGKLGKIKMPKDMESAGSRRIGYSETDINGHANNIHYADYACDAIELEKYEKHYLKTLQVTYSAECLAGQTIQLQRKYENQAFYVRGVDKDGKPHFDIRMEVAEI